MEWKNEFATGIHNIDRQHRAIVEFVSAFENAANYGAPSNDLRPLILRAKKIIEFHFYVEESLMQILPYPNLAAHRAEHRRELQTIVDIENRIFHEHTPRDCAQEMRDCLIEHIVHGDKSLAQYAFRLYSPRPSGARNQASAEF